MGELCGCYGNLKVSVDLQWEKWKLACIAGYIAVSLQILLQKFEIASGHWMFTSTLKIFRHLSNFSLWFERLFELKLGGLLWNVIYNILWYWTTWSGTLLDDIPSQHSVVYRSQHLTLILINFSHKMSRLFSFYNIYIWFYPTVLVHHEHFHRYFVFLFHYLIHYHFITMPERGQPKKPVGDP